MTTDLLEKRKTIALAGAIIKADRGPKGQLTAVVNTSYLDRQGDVMAPGCWAKVVREQQRPLLFWQHDYSALPLGSASNFQELRPGDPRIPSIGGKSSGNVGALLAQLNFSLSTTAGHDAFTLASDGHIKEFSVAVTNRKEDESTDYQGVRTVKMVDEIVELSLVIKGASLGTYTVEAKSALARLMRIPATMLPLIEEAVEKAAEEAEDRMFLALQAAENRAWEESYHKAIVRDEAEKVVAVVRRGMERARQVAEIERLAGHTGNVYKAVPRVARRPLTEREQFEKDIARRAGILVG
jgi:phage head maturation protease